MQASDPATRIRAFLNHDVASPDARERRVRILVGCSLAGWVVWALLRPLCHPYADLACGNYSDHFSDMNIARALVADGLDVWRSPLRELGDPLTESEIESLPPDIRLVGDAARKVPGWPADKPFVSSFEHLPSINPPGGLALTAPVAAAYHFTSLSFTQANRMLIALFLVYAHLSLYVFFGGVAKMELGSVGFLGGFAVYGETIYFTLQGFSEAAVIGPLILSAFALSRNDGLKGIAWFTLAVSFHFRALFFLPLFAYGVYLVLRDRQWKAWTVSSWGTAAASLIAGSLTLLIFWMLRPALAQIPVTNAVQQRILWEQRDLAVLFVGMLLLLAGVLIRSRAWADLVLLLWIFTMFTWLNEAYPWNVLSLMAWMGMPVAGERRHVVRDVRFAALLFLAMVVLKHESYPVPIWIQQVI